MTARGRVTAPDDGVFMRRALWLAQNGWGQTAPNPMVGAVVVRDGVVAGEGWHTRYGASHAEIDALAAAGEAARGATVYVTLEPCNHHGQTPPCVDALLAAGVWRVVIAARDPNPVATGGAARLLEHGVQVDFGLEETAARELNAAPFHDWNRRIERECYRAVVAARLPAADGRIRRIVNTLESISFNVGPTLPSGSSARRRIPGRRCSPRTARAGSAWAGTATPLPCRTTT